MALVIVLAYLVGSVPFALLLARRWGAADLRLVGSGNVGAANVLRASGVRAGVLVAVLDIAKGAASVALASPVWLRFRGGKGVATACGVFSVLTPIAVPPSLLVFLLTVWGTKYISLGSIVATVVLPSIAYATGASSASLAAAFAAAALIIFRHRSNVARLLDGTERRLGVRA
jgi:glycerol-3-phosphate acyltransferase PlsY